MAALVAGSLAVTLGASGSEAPAAAVRQADAMRCAAMMRGDGPALAALLSDELRFVHSDGRIESKADYVRNLLAGDTAYAEVRTAELQTREPAPGVVVLFGAQEMRKRLGPTWSDVKLRFMAVWRLEDGRWRMFAWQSMRPAGSSAVPAKK